MQDDHAESGPVPEDAQCVLDLVEHVRAVRPCDHMKDELSIDIGLEEAAEFFHHLPVPRDMAIVGHGHPFLLEAPDNGLTVPFRRLARGRVADMTDGGRPEAQFGRKRGLKDRAQLPELKKIALAIGRDLYEQA